MTTAEVGGHSSGSKPPGASETLRVIICTLAGIRTKTQATPATAFGIVNPADIHQAALTQTNSKGRIQDEETKIGKQ